MGHRSLVGKTWGGPGSAAPFGLVGLGAADFPTLLLRELGDQAWRQAHEDEG